MAGSSLLVIAGHDPSGAGIDADREAAESFDVRAHTIVTARTEQDDHGVYAVGARPATAWSFEASTALSCEPTLGAVKFGLLPGVEHVRAAVELVRSTDLPVVVDPVISASSGRRFLFAEAVDVLAQELLAEPVVTPNLPEAAELTGVPLAELLGGEEARIDVARRLLERGARAVVLKGGHGAEDPVLDLVVERDRDPVRLRRPRVRKEGGARAAAGIRGSGCRFASRLAAGLARGERLELAAHDAGAWVAERIAAAAGSTNPQGA